jgi:hypothetical protein
LTGAGLNVVVVAMGEPKHAERYCGSLAPSLSCLIQEGIDHYKTYGLQDAGFFELVSVNVLKNGFKASQAGFLPGQPVGDVKMMPGSFIVDKQGIIRYAYYGKDVSDHPEIEELIRVGAQVAQMS